jgi:hypothetical protein
MSSLADAQRELDAQIFADIGELMLVDSAEIPGVFFKRPRELDMSDGTFVGVDISFDCQITDAVAALERNDSVSIVGRDDAGGERDLGTYLFQRRLPNNADESGRVTCELGYDE